MEMGMRQTGWNGMERIKGGERDDEVINFFRRDTERRASNHLQGRALTIAASLIRSDLATTECFVLPEAAAPTG